MGQGWVIAMLTGTLAAAVTVPVDSVNKAADASPVKPANDAFKAGRFNEALTLAGPLADQGNAEALYLLGFAHESGKGVDPDPQKAIAFYRKAIAANNPDAVYRLAFLWLASEKPTERASARELLETAAKTDPQVAGRVLGEAYLRGRLGPAAEPDKAVFWWQRAADAGDIPSLLLIARFYEGSMGFPAEKNLKLALANYAKAAGLGNGGAMAALGSRYLSGDPAIRDEAQGREWLKKAIEAKETAAYLALGDFEERLKKDPKAALVAYENGAKAGQLGCMLRAADFYLTGKDVAKNDARGAALLNQAATAGSAEASFRLAVRALAGEKPDLLVGYGHLLKAANGNLLEAQNELGLFYLAGKLATADAAAGVRWLTQAAEGGYAPAQTNLATLYERGVGVPQNYTTAIQLYNAAAAQAHAPATLALARLAAQGGAGKPNPISAWAMASLAAERGATAGTAMAAELAKTFDAPQLAAAQAELASLKAPAKPTVAAPPQKAAKAKSR
jgi:uncharacterized protein